MYENVVINRSNTNPKYKVHFKHPRPSYNTIKLLLWKATPDKI